MRFFCIQKGLGIVYSIGSVNENYNTSIIVYTSTGSLVAFFVEVTVDSMNDFTIH